MPDRTWKAAERRIAAMLGGLRVGPSGTNTPDVTTSILAVEVKTRKSLPAWLKNALDQAERNAGGKLPVVVLHEKGVAPRSMKSKPEDRALLINHLLVNRTRKGRPCFLIHPRCHRLISGFRGLYRFKEARDGKSTDKIDKTEVVHLFDAMGYSMYNNLYLKVLKGQQKEKPRGPSFWDFLKGDKKGEKDWRAI